MDFKPTLSRVFIEQIEPERVLESGIVIPGSVEESTYHRGRVIAVGPGKPHSSGEREPMRVKEGDFVIYNANMTVPIQIGEKNYGITNMSEIIAVYDENTVVGFK